MKNLILITFLLFFSFNLFAQKQHSFRLHLQGYNLVNPGIELAYEMPLITATKTNKKTKNRHYQIAVSPVFEFYHQRINHSGLSLGADLILRTISHKGFEIMAFGNTSLLQTILAGEIYELDDNNQFTSGRLKGNRHFQWKTGIGFGYNAMKTKQKPYAVNMRLGIRQQNMPASPIVGTISIGMNYFLK